MAYPGKPKYTLLSRSDTDLVHDGLDQDPSNPPRKPNVSIIIQTITCLVSIAILLIVLITPQSSPKSPELVPKGMNRVNPHTTHQREPCGTDAATARANGCIFDLLTLAWLAPECYDGELSQEFLEVASEPFYFDEEATEKMESYEVLSEIPIGVNSWTTRKYHIYHCAYGWRLMHRTLERGGMLEDGLSGYHHTEHCTATLMNTTVPMDSVITKVEISFPNC